MDSAHGEGIQTFPQTSINITQDGMILHITLAPGLAVTYGVGEQMMNEITKKWLETRQQVKQQLAIIHDIRQSRTS